MRNLVLFPVCLVVLSQCFQGGNAWSRRIRIQLPKLPPKPTPKPTPPPVIYTAPVARNPDGLPQCSGQVDVNKILRQGASGNSKRRVKRQISWPYDCSYASIVNYKNSFQFMTAIYSCCDKCRHPTYAQCLAKSPPQYWECPSIGLHCIVDCVAKHDPNRRLLTSVVRPGGGFTGIVGGGKQTSSVFPPKKKKLKCTETAIENGKKCIKQLCVSLLGPT